MSKFLRRKLDTFWCCCFGVFAFSQCVFCDKNSICFTENPRLSISRRKRANNSGPKQQQKRQTDRIVKPVARARKTGRQEGITYYNYYCCRFIYEHFCGCQYRFTSTVPTLFSTSEQLSLISSQKTYVWHFFLSYFFTNIFFCCQEILRVILCSMPIPRFCFGFLVEMFIYILVTRGQNDLSND